MSQTVIPYQFERYLVDRIDSGLAPDMNEFVFAYIPNLDVDTVIDRNTGIPDESVIVYRQDVDQVARLDDNTIIYSVIVSSSVPEFTFNALYIHDKNTPNSCGMIVHKLDETKETNMTATKSVAQQYDGAAALANITIEPETWQIDFRARLTGMDEERRLDALEIYGHTAFISGFDVSESELVDDLYKVSPGIVHVGGLRAELTSVTNISDPALPIGLYVDVVRNGTTLSVSINTPTIKQSTDVLTDYVDELGRDHFVAALAGINADGSITDWRRFGGNNELERQDNHASDSDIDGEVSAEKHIKLPQFWRAMSPSRLVDKLWLSLAAKIAPVGTPQPWLTDTAPTGWAIMKGQTFNTTTYPELAKVFPLGIIPDMRGAGLIGKEDGETVASYEEGQVKSHGHSGSVDMTDLGTKSSSPSGGHGHPILGYVAQSRFLYEAGGGLESVGVPSKNNNDDVIGVVQDHAHSVAIGSHAHTISIAQFGASKNTINHRKANWIVRLA
jgi:hypothetical protein